MWKFMLMDILLFFVDNSILWLNFRLGAFWGFKTGLLHSGTDLKKVLKTSKF
jgi:hypothetical protein